MIDSTNVRVLADNITKLWEKFKSISGDLLPSRSTATTGQILKLTGETKMPAWADEYSYTPPAYSTTETATGQKWIDGKDIYKRTFVTTTPTSGFKNVEQLVVDSLVDIKVILNSINQFLDGTSLTTARVNTSSGYVVINAPSQTSYQDIACYITVYYTKPDPATGCAPEDSEQEPEVKTTKKKTSK